ncbi:hypothetical protein [Brachyspira pilosicoli]|uniref:Uncharacterized protein n=1 Tax=Brachyspira pilosicoli TaxID=52584 RepID=A0A5C8FCF2_BRAPL|nr:hypothetical protein [Brachyspira pilosicoli]TXJ47443.1 hypothetical protein EPJ72_00300 [Brachyspira pilosicoli]
MLKKIINRIKYFYAEKRKLFIIILSSWFVFIIVIGIILGLNQKPDIVPLTPEEENAMISNEIIRNDDKKVIEGEMLSTKNNLSFEELERSRNYVESRKNK